MIVFVFIGIFRDTMWESEKLFIETGHEDMIDSIFITKRKYIYIVRFWLSF